LLYFFIFIKQVLNPDKSCKNAVADLAAEQLITEGKIISTNTGSYSDARQRLPEQMISEWINEEAIRDGKNHIKLGLENQINALKAHKPVVAPWLVEDTFTVE
jgi:hypothetical protein